MQWGAKLFGARRIARTGHRCRRHRIGRPAPGSRTRKGPIAC